jgi:hypothetical protein
MFAGYPLLSNATRDLEDSKCANEAIERRQPTKPTTTANLHGSHVTVGNCLQHDECRSERVWLWCKCAKALRTKSRSEQESSRIWAPPRKTKRTRAPVGANARGPRNVDFSETSFRVPVIDDRWAQRVSGRQSRTRTKAAFVGTLSLAATTSPMLRETKR